MARNNSPNRIERKLVDAGYIVLDGTMLWVSSNGRRSSYSGSE